MNKSVSLNDAVSIVYEGVSCAGLPSGAEFRSLSHLFQRLNVTGFGWGDTLRCDLRPHSLYVSLPRMRIGDRVYSVRVLFEVRDADGVRIPGWRLVELCAEYERERAVRHREVWADRYRRDRYEFRDGPVPGTFKRRRHKRKHPHLRSEMIANQIIEDDEYPGLEVNVRAKRAHKTLQTTIWYHHGRSRRGHSWKEYRSEQWRS
jgi:hypothetical protein